MNRNTLLLLAVFAVGCAAGMHLDSRAQAQSLPTPARVQKWQQFCLSTPGANFGSDPRRDHNQKLKELGEQGWELVSSDLALTCVKRPVQ
jgi:hypothetical protein